MKKRSAHLSDVREIRDDLHRLRSDFAAWDSSVLSLAIAIGDDDCVAFSGFGPRCADGDAIITGVPQDKLIAISSANAIFDRAGALLRRALAHLPDALRWRNWVERHPPNVFAWAAFLCTGTQRLCAQPHGTKAISFDDPAQISVQAVDRLLTHFNEQALPKRNTSAASRTQGRPLTSAKHEMRKLVCERYEKFKLTYKDLRYSKASYEFFAEWATDTFEDMPSDDPDTLKRMVQAYRKTPNPKTVK